MHKHFLSVICKHHKGSSDSPIPHQFGLRFHYPVWIHSIYTSDSIIKYYAYVYSTMAVSK